MNEKMKKWIFFGIVAMLLSTCHEAPIEIVDFDSFHVTDVKYSDVIVNGELNPEIRTMELGEEDESKIARINLIDVAKHLLGTMECNKVIQIAGTYTGHDIDGSPITLSGKVLLPANGKIKNMLLVSHWTIGANYECPSECFPLEGIFAAKGYAVVIADYIGYGVTSNRVHPYMHLESTARSEVDMALAVKPYLKAIGREPESDQVILVGYSQGGSTTLGVMKILQDEYSKEMPIEVVYAGGGAYDMAATFDVAMMEDRTGIPCAIPMIVQGINEGDGLGLNLGDFFKPVLMEHLDEWVNSKKYTVFEINHLLNAKKVSDLMTATGRDKHNPQTAKLYRALMLNSILFFTPHAPVYLFHSRDDNTVSFINAAKAEEYFKGNDVIYDFGNYGNHQNGAIIFIYKVCKFL
jgi:pimeloyl-ACP methyl ester carboxylesterase